MGPTSDAQTDAFKLLLGPGGPGRAGPRPGPAQNVEIWNFHILAGAGPARAPRPEEQFKGIGLSIRSRAHEQNVKDSWLEMPTGRVYCRLWCGKNCFHALWVTSGGCFEKYSPGPGEMDFPDFSHFGRGRAGPARSGPSRPWPGQRSSLDASV